MTEPVVADRTALVVGVDRGACDLAPLPGAGADPDLPPRATWGADVLVAVAADPTALPCAGDHARVRTWPDGRVTLEQVLPRRTAFVRGTSTRRSERQVLAANIDLVMVVVPLDVEPDLGRLERLVALAWDSGAAPLLVMTKADAVPHPAVRAAELEAAAPGVDGVVVSAVTGEGMADLAARLPSGTLAALLGTSGAGKSTLVNALAGGQVADVDQVGASGKGRHTTVRREVVPLPWGAAVVDTPGLRGVALGGDVAGGLASAFPEIDELAGDCRFNDCGHATEPDCAVLAAVDDGSVPQRRLDSWRKLQREAAYAAARTDARLRSEQRRAWKQISKSVRQAGVIRP